MLHCCSISEDKQIEYFIIEFLKTFEKVKTRNNEEYVKYYNEYYEKYKLVLKRRKINITEKPQEFSRDWLREYNFKALNINKKLSDYELIKENSPLLSGYKSTAHKDNDYLYSLLSDYVHAHILIEKHGSERFWIMAQLYNLSIQISELVNIKILDNKMRKDIYKILEKTSNDRQNLIKIWKS